MPHRPAPPRRKAPHHTGRPWLRLRRQVLDRDNWQCQLPRCLCPTRQIRRTPRWHMDPEAASVDMIHPKSHGGSDRDPTNLRASHNVCNSARGNRTNTVTTTRWTTEPPRIQGQPKG